MMKQLTKDTYEEELPGILEDLHTDTTALWGLMGPQHMVEHLIVTWKVSRGRIPSLLISEKDLDKKRAWLMTDQPYDKHIQIPALQGKVQPLRFPDLDSAKRALLEEMKAFHAYYDEHPGVLHINPVFGELDRAQWEQLHYKHLRHHFSQFGLVSNS